MMRLSIVRVIVCILLLCFLMQGCAAKNTSEERSTSTKELSAEAIYEKVSPSVVEFSGVTSEGTSTGTGFFYDREGTIITNYHVIKDCTAATITLADGEKYRVTKVLGYDEERDLAILSTSCEDSIPLKIRGSDVKTGEKVYAIGSSLGFLSGSLSDGIVSSAKREVEGQIYIQTTTPISQGNSGGPLIDKNGKVVGIITAYFVEGQNLNLAIPVSYIDSVSTKKSTTLKKLFSDDGYDNDYDYDFDYDFDYDDDDYDYDYDYDDDYIGVDDDITGNWIGIIACDMDGIEFFVDIGFTFYRNGEYYVYISKDAVVDAIVTAFESIAYEEGVDIDEILEELGYDDIYEYVDEYMSEVDESDLEAEGYYEFDGINFELDGDEIEYFELDGDEFAFEYDEAIVMLEKL